VSKRYLVTGGAGFIGSNIAEALVQRGDRVRILDDFSTGRRENVQALGAVEVVEGDLRDAVTVRRAVEGVDGVFHEAALRSVPRSVDDPLSSNQVNVTGTLVLLLACRDAGVRRVVYASSSSVYGDDPALPKIETLPTRPISPYAVSKLAAEHYCQTFARLYGLETASLRYFNVFGPRQNPESKYSAVIPRFLAQALAGEPLEVHGDGEQSRDFTYIDNVVAGNLLAMDVPAAAGEVFNIACGTRHSLLAIADAIADFLGRKLPRTHVAPRAGDVRHTLADIGKAERLLGYRPLVDFATGMRRTCEYFVARFGGKS
jgi:UDP-N-acetylglucosamine/UDP-N-acetyl-alpha-D-glucosaminouronate 4-epimerase